MKEAQPTLEEVTSAVFALHQESTQWATEGMVEQADRATLEQRTIMCGSSVEEPDGM